jgi:hypothetical protein
VNELVTAYLRALYAFRRGRLSPADAMNHVVDLLSVAQDAKTSVGKWASLWRPGSASEQHPGSQRTSGGERHA